MRCRVVAAAVLVGLGCLGPVPAGWAQGEREQELAGYIFETPVPMDNYLFAKRVSHTFPRPNEERLQGAEREDKIWEALILHYESSQQEVNPTDEEMEQRINSVLRREKQTFTRSGDPDAYAAWIQERIGEINLFRLSTTDVPSQAD